MPRQSDKTWPHSKHTLSFPPTSHSLISGGWPCPTRLFMWQLWCHSYTATWPKRKDSFPTSFSFLIPDYFLLFFDRSLDNSQTNCCGQVSRMLLWLSQATGPLLRPQRNKPGYFDQPPRTTRKKKGFLTQKRGEVCWADKSNNCLQWCLRDWIECSPKFTLLLVIAAAAGFWPHSTGIPQRTAPGKEMLFEGDNQVITIIWET